MKYKIIYIILLSIVFFSCEKDEAKEESLVSVINILYPEDNSSITCEECTIEIISELENWQSVDLAQIYVNNNLIFSGLANSLTAHYQPPSTSNQTLEIRAELINFNEDGTSDIVPSDIHSIDLNYVDINPDTIDPVFMSVNDQFSMMRFPVTNRDFINFLNSNDNLEVELVHVLWGDENGNNYRNPELCHDRDVGDQYEPTDWWYVNVKASFGNQNIPQDS